MSIPRRQRIEPLVNLTQVSIPVPEDKATYNDVIIGRVEEMFAASPQSSKLLLGLDMMGFNSRRQEGELFIAMKQRGYEYKVVQFSGKTGQDTGVLITRMTPVLPPQVNEEQSPP